MSLAQRGFAAATAAAGLLICLSWAAHGPAPSDLPRAFLPLFVEIVEQAARRMPMAGRIALWLVAITIATSCGLGLYLALKSRGAEAAQRLAIALGCCGLAFAYLHLVLPYPIDGRPASELPRAALFALDSAAFLLWFAGAWYLVRVWRVFPQAITQHDWERHVAAFLDTARAEMRASWRRWVYPERLLRQPEETEGGGMLDRLVRAGSSARERARLHAWIEAPGMIAVGMVLAVTCAALEYALRGELAALAPGQRATGAFAMLSTLGPSIAVWVAGAGAISMSYAYLEFHRKWGTDDDRRRIGWIYSTVFAGGVIFLVVFLGGFALFILLVFFALESAGGDLERLLLLPLVLGAPLFVLACVVSIVVSVRYRGAIDPRLAAGRITVWGVLGILVALAFVFLERAVTIKIVQWLAVPAEWGTALAGGLAAATIAPLRGVAERNVGRLVARYLPPDLIAGGERRACAVALCDLSGYTALSGTDEKRALLLAALLQQQAAQVVDAAGGRVVKSMGDAVLLEFEDAAAACAALESLHVRFPAAAAQLGMTALPLHSGAHLGEVVVGPDGDLYGQTVNLAARLQGEAKDGEIVLSEALVLAAGLPAGRVQPMGARTLKNVKDPMPCVKLLAPALAAADEIPIEKDAPASA